MNRRLFTILAALSLLLCVAVCVLWVRSYRGPRVAALAGRSAATTLVPDDSELK